MYSEHCQTFKMEHFSKRMPKCRCAIRNFPGKGRGFMELEHFNKHFVKTQEEKDPQGNILQFFFLKFNPKMDSRFSPKSGYFFRI